MLITEEQKKLILDVQSRFHPKTSMEELAAHFGYKLNTTNLEIGGGYAYFSKEIWINEKYNKTENDKYDTFFHEFGHLIHHATQKGDYYGDYAAGNQPYSEMLSMEQTATLIGLNFWNWRNPGKELPSDPSYFDIRDAVWLKGYYKDWIDVDVKSIFKCMSLADATPGKFRILSITCDKKNRAKLLGLGIIPGREFEVVLNTPKNPIIISDGFYKVGIDRKVAGEVTIEFLS